MFLFTTPVSPTKEMSATPQSTPVLSAIREGADATGTGFDYLVRTAQRESALDPGAKARSSSATGLFQFIEQTWLAMVRDEGAKHGLGDLAKAVTTGSDGRATVNDPQLKREILALRHDPKTAAAMAGELTQRNRDHLQGQLGRAPTDGELYIAHVLGAQGATELIRTTRQNPTANAAAMFPEAAGANRAIFFDRSGRARGAAEIYATLTAGQGEAARTQVASDTSSPSAQPIIRSDGPAMFGLFRTDGPRGPVSEAVSKLWLSNGARAASSEPAQRFFPRSRSDGSEASATATTTTTVAPLVVTVPAPPQRPDALNAASEPATGTSITGQKRGPRPLDLSRFMNWRAS